MGISLLSVIIYLVAKILNSMLMCSVQHFLILFCISSPVNFFIISVICYVVLDTRTLLSVFIAACSALIYCGHVIPATFVPSCLFVCFCLQVLEEISVSSLELCV